MYIPDPFIKMVVDDFVMTFNYMYRQACIIKKNNSFQYSSESSEISSCHLLEVREIILLITL